MLLGTDTIVKQLTKLLGNVLVKMNMFPVSMSEGEKVVTKLEDMKRTVNFQLRKSITLATAVG